MLDFQNDLLIERIFSWFDRDKELAISPTSWVTGLSVVLRGTLEEKTRFCFSVYDMMGQDEIRRDQIFHLVQHEFNRNHYDENPDDLVRDYMEILMKKMDHDCDGVLSFKEYAESVRLNPDLLEVFGYCLPPRPAVYTFMTTFTPHVTSIHAKMYSKKPFRIINR